MTTDDNIMKEMLERVTSREAVDELAIQMFCLVVRSNAQLILKANEMILTKIRSSNVDESTRAITLLEECMNACGSEYQDEIGKFRFLNELIRLVSKKYQGNATHHAIKQRIMECLLLWTTEFPQKTKIREAYDMLNKEGGIEHSNAPATVAKRESVLGIDEEKLAKLIKSGDPQDLNRANLLIRHSVQQEARRTELLLQHKSELQEVQNTIALLNQMLDTYEGDNGVQSESNNETVNLIRELYLACKKKKPILQRLPELLEETDENLIADTLEAIDALQAVMKRYKNVVVHHPSKVTPPANAASNNTDLLSELLGVMQEDAQKTAGVKVEHTSPLKNIAAEAPIAAKVDTFDELSDIFGNMENKTTKYPSDVFGNLDLLQPVNVFTSNNETESQQQQSDVNVEQQQTERRAFRELREIDKLSEELFKQNMQPNDRIGSFKKKEPEKLTLNDLVKEKSNFEQCSSLNITPVESVVTATSAADAVKRSEILDSIITSTNALNDDDEILSDTHETTTTTLPTNPAMKAEAILSTNSKHLSEIVVDLDELTPTGVERVLLDDEDIKITLNFTADRPSSNISVMVIAVSNKSKNAIKDFQLEACSAKKPCKVRLLPPTDNSLPPYKPYRPPTPINQILLLLNPTGKPADITCIFGYKLGEDPDPIKESITAKDIPYID